MYQAGGKSRTTFRDGACDRKRLSSILPWLGTEPLWYSRELVGPADVFVLAPVDGSEKKKEGPALAGVRDVDHVVDQSRLLCVARLAASRPPNPRSLNGLAPKDRSTPLKPKNASDS